MNKLADDLEAIATSQPGMWEELRGERAFLTGGTGFFGCWLTESFLFANRFRGLGARLTILTRDPEGFAKKCPHLISDPALTLHAGDVRDFAFPPGKFRFIIHAATEASAKQAEDAPLEMLSTIIAGTERALQFASACGARQFLLTSSGAVYGRQPPDLTHVSEAFTGAPDPLNPASLYGEGKRAAELLCSIYGTRSDLECKIARCWAFCGPHLPLNRHFAIGNFIRDALAGTPIQIQGDGTPRRSYLYAADLALWLWTILLRGKPLVPINVGSSQDVNILELAQTVARVLNPQAEIRVAKSPEPNAAPSRYVPCVDRARDELGLHQTVGLEEMISRTAKWLDETAATPLARPDRRRAT